MAHVAELGLAPVDLAIELGFGAGRALMGLVLAHLAVKVRAVIALVGALRLEARVSNFVQTVRPIRRSLRSYGDVATQGIP
jgi:hypothetical protein